MNMQFESSLVGSLEAGKEPLLIEHAALAPLMAHAHAAISKGLQELKGEKIQNGAIEKYAFDVFDRVCELDGTVASLKLALNYLVKIDPESNESVALYRYHYENYIFRMIGLVDRAYRLVGTSLFLDQTKIEAIGGNREVSKSVKAHPQIASALKGIKEAVEEHKPVRNRIIHSSVYSTRELSLFEVASLPQMKQVADDGVKDLKRDHFADSISEAQQRLSILVGCINTLLVALSSTYQDAVTIDL